LDPDTPLPHEPVQAIQLPKPFKITAKHVNNMAHTTKTTKKRNRRKNDNTEVSSAYSNISTSDASLKAATTLGDLARAQAIRMDNQDIIEGFENDNVRVKEQRNQRLRNRQAVDKITECERKTALQYLT
ncbi:hypothetical protein BGZ81_005099, partial [Podila clonocystis]